MEQEHYLTGYCRQLDASRMVEVITEDGHLTEADCLYPNCIYQSSCPVAEKIQALPEP